MRDITDWVFVSHGEKSTLEKVELLSPESIEYIMKYPRDLKGNRVNWEDVNEIIAAKIANLLDIKVVSAEIAYRNRRRGCLMLHFLHQYGADLGEPGASLFTSNFGDEYYQLNIQENEKLISDCFSMLQQFTYYNYIKFDFIMMNVFDILIGNQDRHPYNWQILFRQDDIFFGPLYDNGASLGWQLPDNMLVKILNSRSKMNKYYKNMKVKAGILENTQPRLKAKEVLSYCIKNYRNEMNIIRRRLELFDFAAYNQYIEGFPLISDVRKEFLKEFIAFRIDKIISAFHKEEK